jgi:hypothetical protein
MQRSRSHLLVTYFIIVLSLVLPRSLQDTNLPCLPCIGQTQHRSITAGWRLFPHSVTRRVVPLHSDLFSPELNRSPRPLQPLHRDSLRTRSHSPFVRHLTPPRASSATARTDLACPCRPFSAAYKASTCLPPTFSSASRTSLTRSSINTLTPRIRNRLTATAVVSINNGV